MINVYFRDQSKGGKLAHVAVDDCDDQHVARLMVKQHCDHLAAGTAILASVPKPKASAPVIELALKDQDDPPPTAA